MNIPLTKNVFKTEADFQEAKEAVKNKVITIDELQFVVKTNLMQLYNEIVSHLFGGEEIDHENIYKRETIEGILDEYCSFNKYLFPVLKQLGYIGVCGRGYTLDKPRYKCTEAEHDMIVDINFHRELVF